MAAAIRILYVDDEPDLLGIGKLFLEQSVDFTVTTALSGPDAFRLLEQEKFDAIISDYQMPGMDGIQFLVEVRTRFGQIPFILFTGRGREEIVIQAINSGVDFYLQKGGDPSAQFAELSHKVRQAISRFNAEKQIKQSEEKFSTAFTISPDPLAITDLKSGTIINANPAFSAWSGYSSDELIGKTTKELNFWANTHDRDEIVTALQAHENILDKAIELRIKNGDIRNCQFSARILSINGNDYLFTRSRDITDQILASQVLQQSEERFRAIFANQQNGIVIIDPSDHRIVDVNPYISNLVGLPKEQIVGKVCHVFICPAQWGKCPITDLGQCVDNSERVLIAADGRKIPIIKTVVPIEFGQKNYLIENIHDITESKKAEDTLRESEARYRLISENTADVIWALDYKTGKFTYVSPSVQKLRGYTPEEVLNQTMAEALTTDSMEAVARLIQERISKRKSGDTSRIITTNLVDQPCKDGSVVSTEVVSTMIFDEQGHPVEIIGISRNITERKLAEATLQESEEKYRQLFELEADAILLVDKETGNLIEANRVAESLYGYSREKFLRMKNTELSAEPDETRRATQDAQTHIPVRYHRKKDGTIFPVEITVNILHWQGRQVHLAAIRDITERKRAEEQLHKTVDELKRFNNLTVNRELQMVALKQEINALLKNAGEQEKYRIGP
jgi:PAS domain S-box-containing protein